jgi:two-component system OmpR family sensor kinase
MIINNSLLFKKESIFFSITLFFVLSFIILTLGFVFLYKVDQQKSEHLKKRKYMNIARIMTKEINHKGLSEDLKLYLKEQGFIIVHDKNLKQKVCQHEVFFDKRFSHKQKIKIFICENNYYLKYKDFIIKDENNEYHINFLIIAIFLILSIIFVILYISIIKKLYPLKSLQESIKNISNQKFDINCSTNKKDEISQLSNEFHNSIQKLNQLRNSRNVFIRNIMHELKTPITKGKLLVELPNNEKNQEKLRKVFYRMESLIQEFATIEELISINNIVQTKQYYLIDIIDNAKDMLMCDDENILEEFENIKIDVNFNLFSIAVKNLLDNGIKYSTDSKLIVQTQNNSIIFKNKSKPLKRELKDYFEPFVKDDLTTNGSFGLGLYIVNHILQANKLYLEYKYIDGYSIFIVKMNKN